jgi:hypothetical protein
MSNLKSASLVLKTADLIDPIKTISVGTISGYFSSTTQLMVSSITTGFFPIYGIISTGSSTFKYYGATENSTGSATLNATTTATTLATTQACSLSGGFLLQTATLIVSNCTININCRSIYFWIWYYTWYYDRIWEWNIIYYISITYYRNSYNIKLFHS